MGDGAVEIAESSGSMDLHIGSQLGGCRILDKLGEGGMGTVYLARQKSLDRHVAIKVLAPEFTAQNTFMRRFEQEAKILADINHANVLHVYDYGEDPQTKRFYMVMEYVKGQDLADVLRHRRRLSEIETLHIMHQAALGLQQAAKKDVIHRDIKPDNLMLAEGGLVKVMDFGLAKADRQDALMTSAGLRVGTPAFMSPEQCDGEAVDSRSDIYSLGITAFVALTGKLPYNGDSPFAIMLKHKTAPVPSVRSVLPHTSACVDDLLQHMMAKSPDDRPQTIVELIERIIGVLREVDESNEDLTASEPKLNVIDTVRETLGSRTPNRAIATAVNEPPVIDMPDQGETPIEPSIEFAKNPQPLLISWAISQMFKILRLILWQRLALKKNL